MSCPKVSDGVMQSRSRFGAIRDKTSNPCWLALGRHALIVVEIASPIVDGLVFKKHPKILVWNRWPTVSWSLGGRPSKPGCFSSRCRPPTVFVRRMIENRRKTAWSDSALAAKKNCVAQKLRWNHVFMQSVWKGMRGDQHFSLHWPDTRSIQ